MSLGVIFPGQGAQSVGMLADVAERFGSVRDKFAQASDALGSDLWDVVQNGPAEALNRSLAESSRA